MPEPLIRPDLGGQRSLRLMVFIAFSSLVIFYYLVEAPTFIAQVIELPLPALFGVVLPFLLAPVIPLASAVLLLRWRRQGREGADVDRVITVSGWAYVSIYAAGGLLTFAVHARWPGIAELPRMEGMHVVTTLALSAPIGMCALITTVGTTVAVSVSLAVLQVAIRVVVGAESPIEACLEANAGLLLGGLYALTLLWMLHRAAEIDGHDATMNAEQDSMQILGEVMASRRRVGAIVHDHIIAALVATRKELKVDRQTIASTASEALRWMRPAPTHRTEEPEGASSTWYSVSTVTDGDVATGERSAHDCADYIQGWIDSHHHPRVNFSLSRHIGVDVLLPHDVWHDLIRATTEALRNVVRHAPGQHHSQESVACTIVVTSREHGISIAIDDDGVGFSLQEIDPNHFGVRQSILERMEVLPGGQAHIITAPGEGSSVLLSWDEEPHLSSARLVTRRYLPIMHKDMSFIVETLSGRIGVSVFLGAMWFHALIRAAHFSTEQWQAPWPTLVAATLYTAAFMAATERRESRLVRVHTLICVVASVSAPALLMASRTVQGQIGNDGWIATYGVFLAALLIIRGREFFGLVIFALQIASFCLGAAYQGQEADVIQWWVVHQSIKLLNVWVCMIVVGLTEQRLMTLRKRARAIETQRRAQAADALAWKKLQAAVMNEVTPVMEHLASSKEITDQLRHVSAQLEIHLRDCLRSPRLALHRTLHPLVTDARERGVSVELIDDSDSRQAAHPPAIPTALTTTAHSVLSAAEPGDRVVIRLLPDRNPFAAAVSATSAQADSGMDVYELIEREPALCPETGAADGHQKRDD